MNDGAVDVEDGSIDQWIERNKEKRRKKKKEKERILQLSGSAIQRSVGLSLQRERPLLMSSSDWPDTPHSPQWSIK